VWVDAHGAEGTGCDTLIASDAVPVFLSRRIGFSPSTGHAFSQGGARQCLQIIGASRPFLFFWIQILALTGLNMPLFSREQDISHVLQFTHNAGFESSFLGIFLVTFLSPAVKKVSGTFF